MITKLTSVKTAIAKVIADLRLQEDDILIEGNEIYINGKIFRFKNTRRN